MSNIIDVVDTQAIVINMQSEVINDLFQILMQHITAEEADSLPCVKKINRIAEIRDTKL